MLDYLFEQYLQNNDSLPFQTAHGAFERLMEALLNVVTLEDGVWVEHEMSACFRRAEKAAFCMGVAKGACLMGELAALSAKVPAKEAPAGRNIAAASWRAASKKWQKQRKHPWNCNNSKGVSWCARRDLNFQNRFKYFKTDAICYKIAQLILNIRNTDKFGSKRLGKK